MKETVCEFCGRMYDPARTDKEGKHPCCNIRSAGEMTGKIISACRILGELGSGAAGTVYLVNQITLQRTAALKILSDKGNLQAVRLFLSEIRAAGKLVHPHIVRIYSVGETDEQLPYAVMEYIDGRTLEDELAEKRRFSEKETRRAAMEIALALKYAWETAHLTHGDLKCGNVMIRRSDRSVCVLDLGLLSALQENGVRTMMGTPLYAAPELVNDAFGMRDFRCDVYSLGIMLYEMLAGHAPFEGSPEELVKMHQTQDAPPLRDEVPEVSEEFASLIDRMIGRYAPSRPGWQEIVRFLEKPSPHADPPPNESGQTRSRQHPLWAVCLTVSLCWMALLFAGIAVAKHSGYRVARNQPPVSETGKPASPAVLRQAFLMAEQGRTAELEKLLRKGFPVHAENSDGNTLLMQAAFFGHEDTVQMLLRFAPDRTRRNRKGETAFDLAEGFPEIQSLLQPSRRQ